ncbi:MAG TPA: rhodanese-like domain-containing protein, partial [Pseudomonadales bacterium]|nr:rhodanese-like domain-containing protein [Pseudomonadales bacterium]
MSGSIARISAEQFGNHMRSGKVFALDVRTPAEYHTLHVEGAVCCPLTDLDTRSVVSDLKQRGFGKNDTLYLLCKSGNRSAQAAEKITAETDVNVVVVEGGTEACSALGLPCKTGHRNVLPLDRQVRIAAGSLALLGAILGFTVAPAWYGLSAFVGAALIFAGVTDICPMRDMLARAPWNQ